MKTLRVVCGIIYKNDKIFIARRKEGKSMAGMWEFPGGKIEKGENEIDALIRELREELGMQVEVLNRLGENLHNYCTFSINLIAYNCVLKEDTYSLTDHDAFEWVYKEDLLSYKMAVADIPLIKLIT